MGGKLALPCPSPAAGISSRAATAGDKRWLVTAPVGHLLPDTFPLSPQFGLSLLYLVLSRGEELQSSDASTELMQDNQW